MTTVCGVYFIIILSVINLLYMHYTMYLNHYLQIMYVYSNIVNLLSVCFDVCAIFILLYYLIGKNIKLTMSLLFFVTLVWSFVNVMYSRFFYQYLPLSSVGQTPALFESFIFDSLISGFRYVDIFYLFSLIFFLLWYRFIKVSIIKGLIRYFVIILLGSVFLIGSLYSVYHFLHVKTRYNMAMYSARINELVLGNTKNTGTSLVDTKFHAGSVRTIVWETIYRYKKEELSKEQIKLIEAEYLRTDHRVSAHKRPNQIKNVIIVLLESMLSAPIDLVVDGKEITPFLNELKKTPNVYYNGEMQPNITIGESGDGQFIYMTGLLPLQNDLTVQVAKDRVLPALPKLLKVDETNIIIPSLPNVWEQADMNKAYGISTTYSKLDMTDMNVKFVSDDVVFKTAMNTMHKTDNTFFSMVLSISTHMPYNTFIDDSFILNDKSYSFQYLAYLNACHYMDFNLKLYIDDLKKKGLYDNSLIIVTADHHAHIGDLNMGTRLTSNLPLYIINGNIDMNTAWTGKMNQLDVYSTILDILQIETKWHGLGRTLLLPDYYDSVNQSLYDISRMIIESDYFKNYYSEK